MNVSLMSFSKKKNSTATPSSGGSTLSGTLREGCSVIRPVIGFEMSRLVFANWNYAYISDFYRYYYIQDWAWEGGLWWAYMEVDPMASFKAGIGVSSCYILRSASAWDDTIIDELYPATCKRKTIHTILENQIVEATDFSDGTYIIGVMSKSGNAGAVCYYALTPSQMSTFRRSIMSDSSYVGITEITDNLLKALFNPAQYLVSANWFPYTISGSGSGNIDVGWWQSSASASTLSDYIIEFDDSLEIEFDVEEENWRGYMFSSPYSTYSILIPPFGEIDLDPQIVAEDMTFDPELPSFGSLELTYSVKVDLISGNGYLLLKTSHGSLLAFREGKMAVPVQLGQVTQDIAGATASTISSSMTGVTAAKMAGSTGVGAAVTVLGTLASATQYAMPRVKTIGMNAGIALYSFNIVAEMTYTPIVNDNVLENGRPLCRTRTISSLSGYIKTMNADVVLAGATDAEQEQVRAFMNGGFFYE